MLRGSRKHCVGRVRGEAGAGSPLAVAVVGAILSMVLLLVPLYSVLGTRSLAMGAADAAALAAADVAIGIVPGIPCEAAASVARVNHAMVTGCQVDGVIVTVRVSVAILGLPVSATATAGPPLSRG